MWYSLNPVIDDCVARRKNAILGVYYVLGYTHTSIYFHTTIYVYKYGPLHTSYKYLATPFIMVYV